MSTTATIRSADTKSNIDLALLLLRLAFAGIMIAHGAQKVFVFGIGNVTGGFEKMGIPMAGLMGPFIALLEVLGPIALIIGLLTRLAALGLALDMLGAIFLVHLKNGFFNPQGIEFPLALAAAYFVIVIAGPGVYSLDAIIARRRAGSA
jgi:putative oxidoreductase